MGDTTEINTKLLSGEMFLGVVALQTPIQKNHYLHDKVRTVIYLMRLAPDNNNNNSIIGERARHSQVCTIENRRYIYYGTCDFSL